VVNYVSARPCFDTFEATHPENSKGSTVMVSAYRANCLKMIATATALCGAVSLVSVPEQAIAHGRVDPALLQQIEAGQPLAASSDPAALIAAGRRLFFEETFGGNGRTCGTCHPATHNFTLDPAFIAKLPASHPLFVHETKPELAGLENRILLRKSALILENLDGFDKPGVLRSVPHLLGLSQTITADRGDGVNRPPFPLANATGWSGDGAPGRGSLREFAIGAIIQHAPKTLNRHPGVDFRLPTEAELDALLAFQLSLGRQADVILNPADPAALRFTEPLAEQGKGLFHAARARDGSTRSCAGCHGNAGANDANGNNRNFATGTMFQPNAPACQDPLGAVPGDGGFGAEPVRQRLASDFCGTAGAVEIPFRGDLAVNTSSLIEAADTPPFFHNNTARTLEEAITFYTTDVFDTSTAGNRRAFVLDPGEVIALGALLRALNALENIRSGNALDQQAIALPPSEARPVIAQAAAETQDAIDVLLRGPRVLYDGKGVVRRLVRALWAERRALAAADPDAELSHAITLKTEARNLMIH
jgi:cytochrome c peroxidase